MGDVNPSGLIEKLLAVWFPVWEPPPYRAGWVKALCPFHGESRPSASVNYDNDAFVCRACDWKGDAISLIKRKEGIRYHAAKRYAEEVLGGRYDKVPQGVGRKPGRTVFGQSRVAGTRNRQVPPWNR